MKDFLRSAQDYFYCFTWIIEAIATWLTEEYPELKFWKQHTNIDDHLWYAERVNGRVAMLVLTTILILELVSDRSIWDIIHVS